MGVSVLDVLYFLAELAVYVAVGVRGWHVHPAVGVIAVLVMAVWWGTLHSPRAPVTLPSAVDLVLRSAWFGIGAAAAVSLLMGG